MHESDELEKKRSQQAVSWMWKEIKETLISRFLNNPNVSGKIEVTEEAVKSGKKPATQAALELLSRHISPC